ncbi:MAG: hypothetical protein ACLVAK_07935 [Clostridia bacterium]
MEELAKMVIDYGVMIIIVAIFLWDYVANKKDMKSTLDTIKDTNENIANCLGEMKISNKNTEKSLELLQKSMDNTDKKIDKILERRN